jgi:hypothetical protein
MEEENNPNDREKEQEERNAGRSRNQQLNTPPDPGESRACVTLGKDKPKSDR